MTQCLTTGFMAEEYLEPKHCQNNNGFMSTLNQGSYCLQDLSIAGSYSEGKFDKPLVSPGTTSCIRGVVFSLSLAITVRLALFLKQQSICSRCDETYPLFRRPTFSRLTCNYIRNRRKGLRGSEGCYKKKKSELNAPSFPP